MAQRLCRSFSGIHSPCNLAQCLGWGNALCFIKPISSAAPEAQHWLPTEGYLHRKLRRAGACWTIQVLARMVPAKALNWLQLAKCWFYPHRLVQLQTLSEAFLEHTLITCRRSCLSHQLQISLHMVAWNYSSLSHDTEIIQPSPETIISICLQKATLLPVLRMWSSLTPAGKVPQALTPWAVQGQSACKCQEMQECQSGVPPNTLEESLTGR